MKLGVPLRATVLVLISLHSQRERHRPQEDQWNEMQRQGITVVFRKYSGVKYIKFEIMKGNIMEIRRSTIKMLSGHYISVACLEKANMIRDNILFQSNILGYYGRNGYDSVLLLYRG